MFSIQYISDNFARPAPTSSELMAPGNPIVTLDIPQTLETVNHYLTLEFTTGDLSTLDAVTNYFNLNYSDAGLLLQEDGNRASTIAAYNFLIALLTSENYATLRSNVTLYTIEDVEVLIASILLKLDFDRSFNSASFYHVDDNTIDIIPYSEEQYYVNHLQILLVQRLLEEGRLQVLEKYPNDATLVVNGELTDAGKMLSFLTALSYTGVSRLGQDKIPVLTTPGLYAHMNELINQITFTFAQQRFIQSVIETPPPYTYFPNYGTIYPGQPTYDYFNNLLNGVTGEVDVRVLFYKRNPDDSIDVYLNGNLNQVGTDEPSGMINVRTPAQMMSNLYELFPLSDKGRFLIGRNQSIYMGRTEQNSIFSSVLPILDIPTIRLEYQIMSYIPSENLYQPFKQSLNDPDFQSSILIFHTLTMLGLSMDSYFMNSSLDNIVNSYGSLRKIFVADMEQMYETAGSSHYVPYEKGKFIEWLNRLVHGNIAILNPTSGNFAEYPSSFTIIFDGDRMFVTVNSYQGYGISIGIKYEVTSNGFIETFEPRSENAIEYMIILTDSF